MPDAFPRDFTFGVATAAYQVEGNIENDWSEWEQAGRLKDPSHRCGRGVDHWNLFEHDVQLAYLFDTSGETARFVVGDKRQARAGGQSVERTEYQRRALPYGKAAKVKEKRD